MSLDERMAALRQRFVDAAAGRADEIETLLRQGELDAVRQLAHGLAGRSGMFGFVALGEIARRVDEAEDAALPPHAEELLEGLRRVAGDG